MHALVTNVLPYQVSARIGQQQLILGPDDFAWTKQRVGSWGLFEFYRREAHRMERIAVPQERVRLKVPNAASHVITQTGRHLLVPVDRIIEVMYRTGMDMQTKYKETSLGGLAVGVVEC